VDSAVKRTITIKAMNIVG